MGWKQGGTQDKSAGWQKDKQSLAPVYTPAGSWEFVRKTVRHQQYKDKTEILSGIINCHSLCVNLPIQQFFSAALKRSIFKLWPLHCCDQQRERESERDEGCRVRGICSLSTTKSSSTFHRCAPACGVTAVRGRKGFLCQNQAIYLLAMLLFSHLVLEWSLQ